MTIAIVSERTSDADVQSKLTRLASNSVPW